MTLSPGRAASRWLAPLLAAVAVCFGAAQAADAPSRWDKLSVPLFEHIGVEHGLPHPMTVAMAQDGDGFIWIGTQRGLARWDGYQMRTFMFDATKPDSVPGDFIQSMHVDRQGRLWIGTAASGIAMFDKSTERFTRYAVGASGASQPTTLALSSDARGGIWIGTLAGLFYLDPARATVTPVARDPVLPPGAPDNQIRSLLVDRKGNVWIGSNGGLARRDAAGGKIEAVLPADGSAIDAVLSIAENERGQMVFGTLKSGIGVIDTAKLSTSLLKFDQIPRIANIKAVAHIAPGRWWATSYGGGIVEFDPDTGRHRRISHRPAVATSFGHDRVAALLRDRSGLVWAANERGIDFYNPYNRAFETVFDAEGQLEIAVTAVMHDALNRQWIALADQGIDIIDADGKRTAALRPDGASPDTALPEQVILAMAPAEAGEAWISTSQGLYLTSQRGTKVKRIALPLPNPYPRIGSLLALGPVLWMGTMQGVLRYEPASGTLQAFSHKPDGGGLTHNVVTSLTAGASGRIWIGTYNGLNRLDPATGSIDQVLAKPGNQGLGESVVSSISLDKRNRLWVGTHGSGIDIFNDDANPIRVQARIGMAAGLPAPIVASLSPELDKQIWAGTTNGLAVINTDTLEVRAFGRADGLALPSYFVGAVSATSDGDLVLGATGGYTIVHRALVSRWAFRPRVVLSAVRFDDQAVAGAQLLAEKGGELVVPAGVKSIEIEAAALDFSAAKKNRYGFWLEGYDKNWVSGDGGRRSISYGNLSPGDYRLRIRGSNRDALWSSNELVLHLKVLPKWHQTWWAYLALAAVLGALLRWAYRLRLRQLERNQARLQALVYSRTQHLEKLNAIVRSINEQLDFDVLLQTILVESSVIKGISAARALVRVGSRSELDTRASWSKDGSARDALSLSLDEAAARYVADAQLLADDVFLKRQPAPDTSLVLAVRIRIEGQVQGYLLFENDHANGSFASNDLGLIKALKEPFVSAFQKAHAMQQLGLARANAEAANRAKSDFLANVSHEIRTPMNAILGFAGLGTHLELAPQPLDYFRKISRAGQNLLGIINDVLDFSKIESGKLELESVPFDVHDVLCQIADLFAWRAAEKGLELVVAASPDVPAYLAGDPLRLSQVLTNLVSNALKFTAQGYVQLQVELDHDATVAANDGCHRLRFAVKDSGVGLSDEHQARLFQAFEQADASTTRIYGGTGLGLAISQQLVNKMGGQIEVDSKAGEGSTFSFTVALREHHTLPGHPQRQIPDEARGKTILVVDDSAPTREVLLLQLRSFGFDASAVGSGAAALMALEHKAHDLVLMDWNMPVMDGIETTRQIKSHPGLKVIPTVIMVTAFDRDHIKAAAEQVGVDVFLVKPVNPVQLVASVLSVLGFAPRTPSPGSVQVSDPATGSIQGIQVLVVDDNTINQQVAGDILLRAGVRVDFADNGVDAVRMVDQGNYDAVLMDIQMPVMDGYQTTAMIREKTQHAELPIIAMTAHAITGYREHCMSLGMNDYVSKPIEPEVLYDVLAKWTGRSQRPFELAQPARAPVAAPAPGIDREAALVRLGGNVELFNRLLAIFAEDFGSSEQQVRASLQEGSTDNAALLVHRVRGAAGNLSATALFRSSGVLEQKLMAGQSDGIDALVDTFGSDLAQVLGEVRAAESFNN
jgi:signal transduction histidine kinase/CheY-like chemotaxis protein/ligand-binding sensor domain-containing protein/HPt (histidine-containing phosphotransfer) domain-containing protein